MNSQELPEVSVIMPTFNREDFIDEAVSSVLSQTFQNFELIIVDDGSTDNTKNKITPYLDDRCTYYNLGHQGNVSRLRNFGLQNAKGVYIAYLDSDDVWEKDKLKEQVQTLQANGNVGLVFTNVIEFQRDVIFEKDLYKNLKNHHEVSFKDLLSNKLAVYPSSILYRKTCLIRVGKHDEFFLWNDLGFITRLIAYHGAIFISKKLTRIRKHNNNISVVLKNEAVGYRDMIKTIELLHNENFISHDEYLGMSAHFFYSMANMYAYEKEFSKASDAYRKAIKFNPKLTKAWIHYFVTEMRRVFIV
jgi:glycosyltransferase involved in cell wall biosynthesis